MPTGWRYKHLIAGLNIYLSSRLANLLSEPLWAVEKQELENKEKLYQWWWQDVWIFQKTHKKAKLEINYWYLPKRVIHHTTGPLQQNGVGYIAKVRCQKRWHLPHLRTVQRPSQDLMKDPYEKCFIRQRQHLYPANRAYQQWLWLSGRHWRLFP